MFPLPVFDITEIAALLVGLLLYRSLRHSVFKHIVWLLLLVVLAELSGRYLSKVQHRPNAWIFNISTNIEFLVYAYAFYKTFREPLFKRLALWFLLLYPVAAIVNIAFIQGFFAFHSYTMSLGSVGVIIFCCLYYYEIVNHSEKITLLKDAFFWFATGLFFFYTGDILYDLFFPFLTTNKYNYKMLFRAINNNLIILLYFCIIIAFICKHRESRPS